MSAIGIGSLAQSFNQYSQYNQAKSMRQLASGKKIETAADDAANAAIANKLKNQVTGAQVASNNVKDMNNLLNISDGAMQNIADGLGRIRELAVQSSSGIYTKSDKQIFQNEINGIIESINDTAKGANYNGLNLLDGSFTSKSVTTGANGQYTEVNIGNMLSDQLGITGFDVTGGKIDFKALDGALDQVLTRLAEGGAMSNRLEYTERALDTQAYNEEVARSRKEDADVAESVSELTHKRISDQVGISMQKLTMEGMGSFLKLLG